MSSENLGFGVRGYVRSGTDERSKRYPMRGTVNDVRLVGPKKGRKVCTV